MVRDFLQEKKKALDKTVNYFVLLAGVLGSLFSLFLWGGEKGKEKTKRQKCSACTFAVHAKIEYCLIKLYLDVYVVVHIINALRQQVFCNIFLCNHYYCWNFVNMTTKQKEKEINRNFINSFGFISVSFEHSWKLYVQQSQLGRVDF